MELDCLSLAVGIPEFLEEPPKHLVCDIYCSFSSIWYNCWAIRFDYKIKYKVEGASIKAFKFVGKMLHQEEYNRLFSNAVF